jgi:hypothetical protein
MIVPAFLMNKNPLSHMCNTALLSVGILYGGNSMINGDASSLNTVDLSALDTITATIIPNMYRPNVTILAVRGSEKKAAVNNAYIGTLALHEMNGTANIVEILSLSLESVLVAMIPVTPHPNPKIIGMNALPDNPINLCMILSITKAALAR